MPVSEKQLHANRANAQRSTGPKSPEGKARVAANRLSHGLAARHVILPGDSADDYQTLLSAFLADLAPVSTIEEVLVHQAAEAHWKLCRIERYEAELLERTPNPFLDDAAARKHAQLLRYLVATRRAFHKALEDLRRSRSEARAHDNHHLDSALDASLQPENSDSRSNPFPLQPPSNHQKTSPPGSTTAILNTEPGGGAAANPTPPPPVSSPRQPDQQPPQQP